MKRVNKKIVGVLVLLVSIGSFYMWKQVQKHGKTNQQETKQKYIDNKPEKPIIHVIDDDKFVFVASNKPERIAVGSMDKIMLLILLHIN